MSTLNKIWSAGRKNSGDDEEFKDAHENENDAVESDVAKDLTSHFSLGSASAKINRTLFDTPAMTIRPKRRAKSSEKSRTPSAIKKGTGNLFGSLKKKTSVKATRKEGSKVQWSDSPTYKHKIIVEITVPVQKTQDKKTKELFENKLSNSMDFIRRYAGGGKTNFSILPKREDDKQSQHIRDRSQFPNHQILWRSIYMQMDSKYSFSPMTERNTKRNIKASMWVGANEDIASIIDEISGDLQSDEGVVIRIKGVQQLKTNSDYCILGLPITFSTQTVIDVTNSVINKVEKIKKDPIEFNVHVAYPYGMPFINRDAGRPFEDNGRRAFIFQVA